MPKSHSKTFRIAVDIADYLKKVDECNKCKKKYKCDLNDYIEYSGAKILGTK